MIFILSEEVGSARLWSWFVVTATTVCAFTVCIWWNYRWHGQQINTGPRVFPIVGCLPQILWNAQRLYEWTTDELKKTPAMTMRNYIPGLKFIETANPANVEHMLRTRFENYPKGAYFCAMFYDLLGLGVFNVDGSSWRHQRQVARPEFNRHTLRDFALKSMQVEVADRLVPILDSFCDNDTTIDFQDLLLRFTFDTACQIAFGSDPGSLNPNLSSVPFAKAFDEAVLLITLRLWGPFPPWRVQRFFNIGSERKLRQSLNIVDDFALTLIQRRRMELSQGQTTPDLLSRYMHVADEFVQSPEIKLKIGKDPRSKHVTASDLYLRDVVIGFLLAGRNTSAAALAWFFWLLSCNPNVKEKIHDEVDAILGLRKGKDLSDELFSFDELKELHYLHAALTESMRLYPPVPEDAKEAAEDDVWPDGTRVAKGTVVSFHVFAMGRNESIWGSDCLEFRPERFLREGVFCPPSPFIYPVFQAGPRACLGMDMAMMQMKLVAATMLLRFVIEVRDGYCAHYDLSLTMKIAGGLPVRVRRRR